MTVNELIAELQALSAQGCGELNVVTYDENTALDTNIYLSVKPLKEHWDGTDWVVSDCVSVSTY